MRGKHSSDRDEFYFQSRFRGEDDGEESFFSKSKIVIVVILAIVAIAAGIWFAMNTEQGNQQDDTNQVANEVDLDTDTQTEKMLYTVSGYDVLGKIVIDNINVEQYILDSKEDSALEKGVIKLYGGTLNNYGNLCLAGHNKDEVFGKLTQLKVGDTFKLVEPDMSETIYEIKQIYSVEANNLECLLPDESKIEVTLITCENGSTTRLIVKAEEKNG